MKNYENYENLLKIIENDIYLNNYCTDVMFLVVIVYVCNIFVYNYCLS